MAARLKEPGVTDDALKWIIRNCGRLKNAEGAAALILRDAYTRGLSGQDEDKHANESYVERASLSAGPAAAAALRRLLSLRGMAYQLGRSDAQEQEKGGNEDGYYRTFEGCGRADIGGADHPRGAMA